MVDEKKEDFMSHIEHYRAVLDDLQKQRNMYQLKVAEIEKAIASLNRLIPEEARDALPMVKLQPPVGPNSNKYAGMSVRWAILKLLNEDATGPMPTGEIATALRAGGILSQAASFAGNVSAVLSVMANRRAEVVATDSGWKIAPNGRQAWAHIRVKKESEITFPTPPPNVQ